jgi:hypothetical protein
MRVRADIMNEEILLLGLCRMEFGPELRVMLRALAEEVKDWEYFATLANSHGVAALVYNNLEKLDFLTLVPAEPAAFLRNALFMSLSRNARNTAMMGEALQVLNEVSIKTVLLKGMALESTVYGNRGLRQMSDADVLVAKQDSIKAYKSLIRSGYVSLPLKSVLYKLIIKHIGKHLPSLIRNGFSLELHHDLFGRENSLTKKLYDTSLETELSGKKVYTPSPQIFFLYLIKHLYSHEINNESQLRLYTDLVVLLEKHRVEIINDELLVLASEAGMSRILAWKLEPLRDLWGISFPGWLNEFTDKWYNADSINKFIFFLKSPKDNPSSDKSLSYRSIIKDIPGIHRKIIFVLGDMFPTITFMKKRYGCKSTFGAVLHYPHRLGKLMWVIKK